jgi:hypothetical protein
MDFSHLLVLLVAWLLLWKGLALWRAARRGEKWWFIALLIIQTLGLLEIFYLLVIAPEKSSRKMTSSL